MRARKHKCVISVTCGIAICVGALIVCTCRISVDHGAAYLFAESELLAKDLLNAGTAGVPTGLQRIAVYAEGAVSESDEIKDLCRGIETAQSVVRIVTSSDIAQGKLSDVDTLVVPGGSASEMASALGPSGAAQIRSFVLAGGGYVGICGGAFLATNGYPWSLRLINANALTGSVSVSGGAPRSLAWRGSGDVQIRMTPYGRTVFAQSLSAVAVPYTSGPIFVNAGRTDMPPFIALAEFDTEISALDQQRGTMIGSPAIIVSKCGLGTVVVISPHVERVVELDATFRALIALAARRCN